MRLRELIEKLEELERVPNSDPLDVIVHYDGHYEAPIRSPRLATSIEAKHSVYQRNRPHVVIEVET